MAGESGGTEVPEAKVAVLIPCLDEALSIGRVVRDFQTSLPGAAVYVFDNGSGDNSVAEARAAGARVAIEATRGKGNVVRRMFADVEADIYLLVDGDGTYNSGAAPRVVEALTRQRCDMVNVARDGVAGSFRAGHRLGNRMLTALVGRIFGTRSRDMLSGYKAFTRRFVKSFPARSRGFEIETELLVHALELHVSFCEISAPYHPRPSGSQSKLRTFRDGMLILKLIVSLVMNERPAMFFALVAALLSVTSLLLGIPVILTYLDIGLVPRLPTAVLAAALMLAAILSLFSGLVLQTVTEGRREMKRLAYLRQPSPPWHDELSGP